MFAACRCTWLTSDIKSWFSNPHLFCVSCQAPYLCPLLLHSGFLELWIWAITGKLNATVGGVTVSRQLCKSIWSKVLQNVFGSSKLISLETGFLFPVSPHLIPFVHPFLKLIPFPRIHPTCRFLTTSSNWWHHVGTTVSTASASPSARAFDSPSSAYTWKTL